MIIDSHIHLYSEKYDQDRDELIKKALDDGIKMFLMPNIDTETAAPMLDLHTAYPNACFPMFGLHPCDVKDTFDTDLQYLHQKLKENREITVAVGETGIDLYWDKSYAKYQEEAFNRQLDWCIEFNLPVVIHSRDALDKVIEILEDRNNNNLRGVFHCFSGTVEQIERINKLDFYFGIGGVVTFKNGGLDKVLAAIPHNRIVLETDGPYLAPAPYRGKRNEPAFIRNIAIKVSELLSLPVEEMENITSENAINLFGLKKHHHQK
jgi:TatD DNase family protein